MKIEASRLESVKMLASNPAAAMPAPTTLWAVRPQRRLPVCRNQPIGQPAAEITAQRPGTEHQAGQPARLAGATPRADWRYFGYHENSM